MENAIQNLPPGEEQMVWMVDFHGYSLANVSLRTTKETAHVLQEHYPERLAFAVLYNPPKFFEPFWKVKKPTGSHFFIKVMFGLNGIGYDHCFIGGKTLLRAEDTEQSEFCLLG